MELIIQGTMRWTLGNAAQLHPLAVTWPYALVFWLVEIWVYAPEFRVIRQARRAQKGATGAARDATFRPLIAGQQLLIGAGVLMAFVLPRFAITWHPVGFFAFGLGCSAVAGLLRRHCFRMLGDDFRGAVTVRAGQEVVQRGAYRVLRHPSYSAAILLHIGFALGFTNWLTLLLILLGIPPLFLWRIRHEERALLGAFGTRYAEYMARTKRIVPGVW